MRYFTSLLLIMLTTLAMAIPAKRGQWRIITLENGEKVKAMLVGDEHLHFFAAEDGQNYVATENGYKVADLQQMEQRSQMRRARIQQHRQRRLSRRAVGGYGNYQGKKKGLILLVQFKDTHFKSSNNLKLYKRIANEENFQYGNFIGSVHDYFYAQSEGKFDLEFDVVGPLTLSQNVSYYGENLSNGDDKKPATMVIEAIQQAASQLDFRDYDWDGDGEVDQVFVLYAGLGEANGGDKNTIWPHESTLDDALKYYNDGSGSFSLNGVRINTYACSSELQPSLTNPDYGTSIDGIGTICHEFSHCLGYPDLYDIASRNIGMGAFDLMDSGSYNGDGFCPAGFSGYERWVAGWKEPVELTNDAIIKNIKPLSEGGADFYILYNDKVKNEYFYFENRQLTGWDAALPGKGLLVAHVDFDQKVWEDNSVNCTSGDYSNKKGHQCLTYLQADNYAAYTVDSKRNRYYDFDDMATDLYPYGKNDSLTMYSKPAALFYYATSNGTKNLPKDITHITQNSDGTITFTYGKQNSVSPGDDDDPIVIPVGDTLLYESFNGCDAIGGNDNTWNKKNSASTNIKTDNIGWTFSERAYMAKQCISLGSSNNSGFAITPTITIDGEAKLTFKAAPWNEETAQMQIQLSSSNGNVTANGGINYVFPTMTVKQWNECEVILSGKGNVQIAFQSTKNRFFLDEVKVEKITDLATGINETQEQPLNGTRIYSLDGRFIGTEWNLLPKGIYIMRGRKIVK